MFPTRVAIRLHETCSLSDNDFMSRFSSRFPWQFVVSSRCSCLTDDFANGLVVFWWMNVRRSSATQWRVLNSYSKLWDCFSRLKGIQGPYNAWSIVSSNAWTFQTPRKANSPQQRSVKLFTFSDLTLQWMRGHLAMPKFLEGGIRQVLHEVRIADPYWVLPSERKASILMPVLHCPMGMIDITVCRLQEWSVNVRLGEGGEERRLHLGFGAVFILFLPRTLLLSGVNLRRLSLDCRHSNWFSITSQETDSI